MIDKQQVELLSRLCRIHLKEDEKNQLHQDLKGILEYVNQLNELDTSDVDPMVFVYNDSEHLTRLDLPYNELAHKIFVDQVPEAIAGMVKVPVIKDDQSGS